MKMFCTTKGDSTISGKPNILFCAHPADAGRCLKIMADDIFCTQNCVIWYTPDAADPERKIMAESELSDVLIQTRLVVVGVTKRLLEEHDPDVFEIVGYAAREHIPVLPVLFENVADDLFARYFGDAQYLSKVDFDPTALPYQEKLAKYLDQILLGTETIEKIREAFDAYIFLSYRKKDRKYAQKLMHLIHENEFCRDIAIWYDEFLVPGEGFNKEIEDSLRKSILVTLAVTPNFVNESNWIRTHEYPMAQTYSKKILPVEMVPTDRTELEKQYGDIPQCVPSENRDLLRIALKDLIDTDVKVTKKDDAAHLFFIGLAYLGGIDVEIDHDRARELIGRAADAGLPEAMEKLVVMYRFGEGVAQDFDRALEWQKKLLDRKIELYRENESEQGYLAAQEEGFALLEMQKERNRPDEAYQVCERMKDLDADLKKENKSRKTEECWYRIVVETMFIHMEQGDTSTAGSFFGYLAKQAYIMSCDSEDNPEGALVKSGGRPETRGLLWKVYKAMADYYREKGYPGNARRYYKEALDYAEMSCKANDTVENRIAYLETISGLGDSYLNSIFLRKAVKYITESNEGLSTLAKEYGGPTIRRDYMDSLLRMTKLKKKTLNRRKASEYVNEAAAIAEELYDSGKSIRDEKRLAVVLEAKADLTNRKSKDYAALMDRVNRMYRHIAEETHDLDCCREVVNNLIGGNHLPREEKAAQLKDMLVSLEKDYPFNETNIQIQSKIRAWLQKNRSAADGDWFISDGILIAYFGPDAEVTVPDGIDEIAPLAFIEKKTLHAVTIPEGVRRIGNCAFESCSNLETVVLPDMLESLGERAWYACKALTSIRLPDRISEIPSSAFFECRELREVRLPEHLKVIGYCAFACCEKLTELKLPDGLVSIGKAAFECCKSLDNITLPDSVNSVGDNAFARCPALKNIRLSAGLKEIPRSFLQICDSMISIELPEGLEKIGAYAFADCKALKSIHLPDTLQSIDQGAFQDCKSLEEISLPDNVRELDWSNFEGCVMLQKIDLPKNLEKIGISVFTNCSSLKEIHIPSRVTCIKSGVFKGCRELQDIYVYAPTMGTLYEGSFPKDVTIHLRKDVSERLFDCLVDKYDVVRDL